jgi:uncharacterized phage-associated protein
MNLDKLTQVINYILQKYEYKLNYIKLIKLLYIADRESLRRFGFSVSGDTYRSTDCGPVLVRVYDFINEKKYCNYYERLQWDMSFKIVNYDLISINRNKNYCDKLSESDIKILDEIDKRYHNKNLEFLIKLIHRFPELTLCRY